MIVWGSNQCVEMIKWLCVVIQSLCGNDPMVVWWFNHCVEMIQWLCGDPIIVWKWSNCCVGFQSIVWKWSNGCVGIQSMCGNDPMVVWGSNHCVEMIQWLCGVLIIVKDNQKSKVGTADFRKKVLSVYTHSTKTIYLSLSAQVAKSTFFHEIPSSIISICSQNPASTWNIRYWVQNLS